MNKRILIVIIVFIVFLVVYGFISLTNRVEINLRDKNKDIIYDKVNKKDIKVPYVNLYGEDIDKINNNIDLFVKDYIDDRYSNITYNYNKNGNILSLIIRIINYNGVDSPEIKFTSYNILLDNSKLISDEELFTLVNSNKNEINKIIENSFIEFFNNSEIRKSIDYDDYINYREYYFEYNKDTSYYIDNYKIYGYININSGIDYSEYEYYLNKDFRVLVGDMNA